MRPMDIEDRLELVVHWYTNMVSPATRRLVASYDPIADRTSDVGSRICDIGWIWDMAVLSRHMRFQKF